VRDERRVEYRTMRAEERAGFLDLVDTAFTDEDPAHFARYLDADPHLDCEDTWVAVEAGRIVSSVQVFTRTIRLRGEAVALGGIGSVATHPDREGRGHATALLRRAIDDMVARGAVLSLLFTGRRGFYERLGWVQVPHALLAVRRGAGPSPAVGRPFSPADLPRVRDLYEAYSGARDGTTVRDAAYWRGQLRFAGNPDEHFAVLEEGGEIVAYARRIAFFGLARVMEHGCSPGAEAALASLLLALAPPDGALHLPRCDAALEAALVGRGAACDVVRFPDQMWRVIDGPRARALAGLPAAAADGEVVRALVSGPDAVFWPSDRF
jgi:predicted N-acetyltransferase YhbS